MKDRGYPTEAFDQTVADLSVEHAATLDHYRAAHDISQRAGSGAASTEELRQAMIHYRALFTELLGQPGNSARDAQAAAAPYAADQRAADQPAADQPANEQPANGRAANDQPANGRAATSDVADPETAPDSDDEVTGEPISGSAVSGTPVPTRPQER
jgi:hypothetical protein